MTLESVTAEQFRSFFGSVYELEHPAVFRKNGQQTIIPFDRFLVDDVGHDHRIGVLETSPYDNRDLDPSEDPNSYSDAETLIRVRYDSEYGLKARIWQAFSKITRDAWSSEDKPEPELLLLAGNMKYDFGPVSIVLSVTPISQLHMRDFMLRRPDTHNVTINVLSVDDSEKMPPLASITYKPHDRKIPFDAEFVDASYEDIMQGKVDQRPASQFDPVLRHQSIYYVWEYLKGARIGVERFQDETSGKMKYSQLAAQINDPEGVLLEGTTYRANIYHGTERNSHGIPMFGDQKLCFTRTNIKTGETWIFSVPEWIDSETFISNLSGNLFRDFLFKYPVVFGVRRLEQEDQWFSTWRVSGREKEILLALSSPSLLVMLE